jgi:hypothetical protein
MPCITSKPDPIDVLHAGAKAFPGIPAHPTYGFVTDGIAGVARFIGRSAGVLHNKFSQADERYEINVREALAIAQLLRSTTGATSFAEAVALQFDGLFVPLPPEGMAADDDVLTAMLESMRSLGDLAREIHEARADGVITLDEFSAIDLRARRLQATIHTAVQTMRTQVQNVSDDASAPLKSVR